MKKTSAFILCIVVLLASSFAAYARPHHGFHHHPAPVVHYSHPHHRHHHYRGPSRGWYNGALIVGATLAGLELVSEIARPPQTTVIEKTVQVPVVQQPQVMYVQPPVQPAVVQQPQPVVIQQQPVVVPQSQPVVVSPLPQASAPVQEQWVILPNGSAVKFK